jgi:nickel transport protein
MRQPFFCLSTLLLCFVLATTAKAHKVNVFAYAEAGTIFGETSFSGGRPAQNAEISVQDRASGTVLLQTRTDSQGIFTFPVPESAQTERLDLLIVALAGEGHRNEWLLTADDYLPEGADRGAVAGHPSPAVNRPVSQQNAGPPAWTDEHLQHLVETAVEKQIGPLKRLLLEMRQPGPGLRDILGGIGYIVGIFGIIALIKAKKGEKR